MSNPTPTLPPPTSSSSSTHHKSKQNLHHSNNQSLQHNKNSGPNHQSSMKKNVRAWGNINNPNNNNNNNNNNNHPQSAWRNNNHHHQSHHYVNGAIVGQSNNQNTHSNQFQQSAIPNDEKLVLKAMHERMVWFIMSLVGYTVTATTKSGQRFQGLLSSAVTESEFSITLKRAVQLPIPSTSSSTPTPRSAPVVKSTLIIFSRELVEVVATDVDLNQASSVGTGSNSGFKTDSETLGTKLDANGQPIIREKELQTWQPAPGDISIESSNPTANLNESDPTGLEDSLFPKNSDNRRTFDKPWDQFEANEKLFGTRTDFDEEIYTTKLDRSGKDFKERERKAEALAREIMGSSSSNPHVQEERGLLVADDSGMNEEDKYGAVIRSEGAYVPPGARKAAAAAGGNKQTLQPSASNSNLNKSGSSSQPQNATNNNNSLRNSKATADGQPAGMNANLPATNSGPRQPNKATPTISGPSGEKATIDRPANFSSKPIPIVNVPSHLNSTTGSNMISKSSSAQPTIKVALSNRPSKQPDEVAPRFKAFVTDEKERLQQKKKDLLKKEKESRLAEFRAFSMSFKLPMAVPKDLEPIIKKPTNNTSTGANQQAAPTSSKQTETDEAGRRASVAAANAQLNRAQPNQRSNMLPSNLQITTNNLGQDPKRVPDNTTNKPPISNAGLKAMVALAAIPPFKPRNIPTDQQRNVTGPSGMSKKGDNQKAPPRFANIPPIPPFKPKVNQPTGSSDNSTAAKLSTKAAAFNPAAKTFTPGPPGQPVGPSSSNRKPLQHADPNLAGSVTNPFFGSKPIKKGSSSMHVKEEFTPFKSSSVPEASHVGPAWNFSGKSYRQMFGPNAPPPLPPPPHPVQQIVPHMMHHQHHPAAQQQQQQQHQHQHQQQQIHHHAPHQQPHGPSHAHHHSQSGPPNNMMPAPIPPPMHLPPHAAGGPHHHHNPIGMSEEEGNGGIPGGGMVVTMGYGPPLPPPIPPYLYHQQPHPQQPQPQSPYNGSYRNNGGGNNGGFGPPVQGFNGPNNGSYYAGSPNGGNSANGSIPPQHFSPHGPPVPGLPPQQQPPQQMYQGPPPPHHQMFQGGHPVPPGPGPGPGPGGRGVPMYAYGPNMGFGPPPPGYGGSNGGGNGTGTPIVTNPNGPNNGPNNGNGQFDQGGGGGPPPPPPPQQ